MASITSKSETDAKGKNSEDDKRVGMMMMMMIIIILVGYGQLLIICNNGEEI
jgi:hypothetical protein